MIPDLLSRYSPDITQATLTQIRRFWQGEGRYVIRVVPEQHNYRQTFDVNGMLERAPWHLARMADLPGLTMPELWTDWGTISTARYWGGRVQFDSTGRNIFIHPAAQTVAEALSLQPSPLDAPDQDGARTLTFFQSMRRCYPEVDFWLHTPDMQGVLNTAGLILNQEAMFLTMTEEPQKLHQFLQKVTDFLIQLNHYLRTETNNRICGNLWPYIFFPQELGVCLTEDLMPLLSRRLYQTFGIPYLKQINDTFGGVAVHCCGRYRHQVQALLQAGLNLRALEFHYPATTLEDVEPLADQAVLVPYMIMHKQDRFQHLADFYRYLIEETDSKYRFYFACHIEDESMLAFAREYGPVG